MKIILSRKGFDSSNGGYASPIMPDGRLLSLPIPVTPKQMENGESGIPYDNLRFDGKPLSEIINQLSGGQFNYPKAHLDPDLDRNRFEPRVQGWKRTLGQQGPPAGILDNNKVEKGDLFLFFGWFRRTRYENGQLEYVPPKEGGNHVIFGWLQIERILEVQKDQHQDEFPMWLHYHPHIVNRNIRANNRNIYTNNKIYIAAEHLILDGFSMRGAGTFPCFKRSLQLTAPGEKKSRWCLPKWLKNELPGFTRPSCTNKNWQCNNGYVPFDSDGRGQEFVFKVPDPDNPEMMKWLKSLFEDCC
jgi:hypothetical protein